MKTYNQNGELITSEDFGIVENIVLNGINKPPWWDASLNKLRVVSSLESGSSLTTVDIVTALTNLTNFNTWQAHIPVISTNLSSWAACCRSRIT